MKNERNMIDTACQLGRSLRVLSAIAVQRPGESREEAEDRSRLDFGMISIVLYALIVELTIKGLWSYENGRAEPEHTHHIANIFNRLQRGTQTQIKRIYESACERYALVQSEGRQQLGKERFQVEMASLEEALQWNANAMIHLKGTSINGGIRYFCDPDVMFSVYEGSGGGDSSSTGQELGNPTLFSSHFMPAVRLFAASAPTDPANHTKRRML